MPLDMTINLDRLRSVRLKLRRGLVKLTMCSAVGLDERLKKKKKKTLNGRAYPLCGIGRIGCRVSVSFVALIAVSRARPASPATGALLDGLPTWASLSREYPCVARVHGPNRGARPRPLDLSSPNTPTSECEWDGSSHYGT